MNNKRKMISLLTLLSLTLGMSSGCSRESEISDGNIIYQAGEHIIREVNRGMSLFGNKSGTFHLEAPLGYKVIDYDYDFSDNLFEFHDYVYENVVPIGTSDSNKLGTPVNKDYKKDSPKDGVYAPGEHILVSIDKNINLLFGKEDFINLEAPYGYEVLDYDYDKTSTLEFENIVYRNVLPVKVTDINSFGVPLEQEEKVEKDFYDVGEHVVVDLQRNVNLWIGKNDKFSLTAPLGYVITDYDYDKTDMHEFQTITYKNVVPVSKNGNDFGLPSEYIEKSDKNYYMPGEHVIVNIDRSVNWTISKKGTKELVPPVGYEILDYDYEYDESFQFETYVYTNNEKVYAEDANDFGKVLTK